MGTHHRAGQGGGGKEAVASVGGGVTHVLCGFGREMSLGCSGLDLEPGVGVFWWFVTVFRVLCVARVHVLDRMCHWFTGFAVVSGCMPSVCGGGPGDRLAPCTSICGLAAGGPHKVDHCCILVSI